MLPPVLVEGAAERTSILDRAVAWTSGNRLLVAAAAVGGLAVGLHYADLQNAPPGFFSDEASVAYDAQGIATDWRDEPGVLLPGFFPSVGTLRGPPFLSPMAPRFPVPRPPRGPGPAPRPPRSPP